MKRSKRAGVYLLLATPALCCVGGLVAFLWGSRSAEKGVKRERTAARSLGMPLTFSEIPMLRVPDAENAGPLYVRAGMLLNGDLKSQQSLVTRALSRTATADDRSAGNKALHALAPVLALMDSVGKKSGCDFHRNWSQAPKIVFSDLDTIRACVRDECLEADRRERQGDWRGAFRSLALAHRITKDGTVDPVLIPVLVQTSMRTTIDRECEAMIGRHTRDRAFLEAMESLIRSHSDLPDIHRALCGEIALGLLELHSIETLRMPQESGEPATPTPAEKQFFQSPWVRNSLELNYLAKWSIGWKSFPRDGSDWAGYGAALKKMEKAIEDDLSPANAASPMLIPTGFFTDSIGVLQSRDRLLLSSGVLLRERLSTGKLPVALPATLGEVRRDPFDKSFLRYRPSGNGFLLYSIGRDRTDDGGRRRSPKDGFDAHYDEVVEFK